MSDNITDLFGNPVAADVDKAQMLDTVAQTYNHMVTCAGDKPVALLFVMVGIDGGASTQWHVIPECENKASLYLARALQIAHSDLHRHQERANENG